MSSSGISSWDAVTIVMTMVPALLILATGTLLWIPAVERHYGRTWFADGSPDLAQVPMRVAAPLLLLVAVLVVAVHPAILHSAVASGAAALFLVSLCGVVCLDLRWRVIPDRFHVSGTLAVWGLLATSGQSLETLLLHGCAGLALPLVLALLTWGWERWRGAGAMGWGDVKLILWLGMWAGPAALDGFLLSCVLGLLFVGMRRLRRTVLMLATGDATEETTLHATLCATQKPALHAGTALREPFAFGPALALGIPLAVFFGHVVTSSVTL